METCVTLETTKIVDDATSMSTLLSIRAQCKLTGLRMLAFSMAKAASSSPVTRLRSRTSALMTIINELQ